MSRSFRAVRRILALTPLVGVIAFAQSTGSMTGLVTDPSGAAVAEAQVTCKSVETGVEVHSATTSGGVFQVPDLPVGSYEVSITHAGFKTAVRTGITLLTGETVDLSLTLQLGETMQSVRVEGSAALVQTTTSEVKNTVDSRQMADLPLNGRNAFDLAVLSPGATSTNASTTPGQQDNLGLAVNGFLATQNNWQMDGGAYNNLHFGSAPTLPNPDALQEFTIFTANFSAENRGGGAVIKLTTRSGTNQFHGTLFEFLRNTKLDAPNFFAATPYPYKQNQYGGTLGGPVKKDKLFFFGSYQGTNTRGNPSPELDTVPTAAQRDGNFSATGKIIVDPLTNAAFPNDIIPQSRIDPIALNVLKYYPLPDYGVNGYLEQPPGNRNDYQWMLKGDYYLGSKDVLTARYFWDSDTLDHDEATVPGFLAHNAFHNNTILVSDTHTFSPTWVMHSSINYLETYRKETPVSAITPQSIGVQVQPAETGIPNKIYFTISGYTKLFSGRGLEFDPKVTEFQTDVSHTFGKHLLRFGTGIRHDVEYALNLADELGNYTFSATRTTSAAVKNSGDAIGSMLWACHQPSCRALPRRRILSRPRSIRGSRTIGASPGVSRSISGCAGSPSFRRPTPTAGSRASNLECNRHSLRTCPKAWCSPATREFPRPFCMTIGTTSHRARVSPGTWAAIPRPWCAAATDFSAPVRSSSDCSGRSIPPRRDAASASASPIL